MRVLGIDTGLAIAGWAIVEKPKGNSTKPSLIACGSVTTESKQSLPLRLSKIYDGISDVIKEYSPSLLAVEDLFYFKNKKTVISVSQARGVILLAGNKAGLPIFNYTPLQVKTSVTGYGRADKAQVQKMVQLIYNLSEVPKPDDIADAIAIATCHCNTY